MDISTLRLFADVMRHRSFTKVAEAEQLSPSSVSRAIARLENELGVKLLLRHTRSLTPTDAGQLYFERILPLVDELDSAHLAAKDIQQIPEGRIRVSAPDIYGQMYIVPLLPSLQALYPGLGVELFLENRYVDLVGERVDVAIRLGALQDSSYVARKIHPMRFHVCASPDYLAREGVPKHPEDLHNHECILFPRVGHSTSWHFKNTQGELIDLQVSGKYFMSNSAAVRQCAVSGMGVALLPDWLIKPELCAGKLVSLFDDCQVTASDFDSAAWILQPSRKYQPQKVKVFVEHLVDALGECGD